MNEQILIVISGICSLLFLCLIEGDLIDQKDLTVAKVILHVLFIIGLPGLLAILIILLIAIALILGVERVLKFKIIKHKELFNGSHGEKQNESNN